MVADLLASLRALDYPADRLEVMLIVEAADAETRAGARLAPSSMRTCSVLVVPEGAPRTKPRATQYALQFARGDYVVVYDAEDAPEPDQLRRALATHARRRRAALGCLQAQLNIYNSDATWFTRQFTIEYAAQFDLFLPGLARMRLPLPLGGSSNHFNTEVPAQRPRRLGSLQRDGGRRPRHPPGAAAAVARRRADIRRPGRRRRRRSASGRGSAPAG